MKLLAMRVAGGLVNCVRNSAFLGYALPCVVIWLLYLVAFWPGLMSQDSIAQWDQVIKNSFSNNYPAFHTLTNWLITRVWLSPAAIALFQIFALAGVFSLTMQELGRWGIGRRVRAAVTALFCLSPVNGMMAISLWKDIPYTCALLGLFVIVLRLLRTEGRWLLRPSAMVLLCVVALMTSLFRHNGLPAMGLFFVVMLITWRKVCLRPLLRVGVNWILIFIIITGPVYSLIGVVPMAKFFALQNILHQIGAMSAHGAVASKADRDFLASIQPMEAWKELYNCYSLNVLIYNQYVQHPFIESHAKEVIELWTRLILQQPKVAGEHQLCVTSMLWQVSEPTDPEGRLYTTETGIVKNDLNLRTESLSPALQKVIMDVVKVSHEPKFNWFVWRPAIYLYFLLSCAAIAAIRAKNFKLLQIGLPGVLNTLVWLPLMTTQDFRFQYPVYAMALIASALLFLPKKTPQTASGAGG